MSDKESLAKRNIDSESGTVDENGGRELRILITDADKIGTDIFRMSNFCDAYIHQLTCDLKSISTENLLGEIPIADLSIINDMIHQSKVVMTEGYEYIPDFDSLPSDIKSKLRDGTYHLGESRQVDGNMRAVIMNDDNKRERDITLKRVRNDPNTIETSRSIVNQTLLRQIYAKLADIQELQSFQIDRDRDRDIVVPFLNARDYILRAQNSYVEAEKRMNLEKATNELTKAINATYTDVSTALAHLAKRTKRPIFLRPGPINTYIGYITLDIQLATKYVGVQMQVFDYLGEKVASNQVLQGYLHFMRDFFTRSVNQKGQSAATLLHHYFPYTKDNRNCWYQFALDMKPVLRSDNNSSEGKEIYIISVEDVDDENEVCDG